MQQRYAAAEENRDLAHDQVVGQCVGEELADERVTVDVDPSSAMAFQRSSAAGGDSAQKMTPGPGWRRRWVNTNTDRPPKGMGSIRSMWSKVPAPMASASTVP